MKLASRLQSLTEELTLAKVNKILSSYKPLSAYLTSAGRVDIRIHPTAEFTVFSYFIDEDTGVVKLTFPCYLYSPKETKVLQSLLKSYVSDSKLDKDLSKVASRSLVWLVELVQGVLVEDALEIILPYITKVARKLGNVTLLDQTLLKVTTERMKHDSELSNKYRPAQTSLVVPSPELQALSPLVLIYNESVRRVCCSYIAVPARPKPNSGYIRAYYRGSGNAPTSSRLFYSLSELELIRTESGLKKVFPFVSNVYPRAGHKLMRTFGKDDCVYSYDEHNYYVVDFSSEVSFRSVIDILIYLLLPESVRDKRF